MVLTKNNVQSTRESGCHTDTIHQNTTNEAMTIALYRRLHHYFEDTSDCKPQSIALQYEDDRISYGELDRRANRLAHFLRNQCNVQAGSRVCILLHRSVETYVALLAVLKCDAAYVPMDPSYPRERILFMTQDCESCLLLSTSELAAIVADVECPVLFLDSARSRFAKEPSSRPEIECMEEDSCCYIIYTSGSTGKPKGVCINHSNICNFITVVVPLYGVVPGDRVYQGITIAFDFSIEEIWPTFAVGACLVAGPTDHRKLGSELAEFLHKEEISVLHCVPTLLSTIDRDLPSVRIINVGGEEYSKELVQRWSPGRTMFNTYGPTETTVSATFGYLTPGKPVTIGKPLPTYTIHILDENQQPVPEGELGEIWIGGKGVAKEYINRPEKTSTSFYPNHLDPPYSGQDPGFLFRTGDMGRFTADGEIEMKGRIDDQVKIRGYRIELSEIEAVIQDNVDVETAVVKQVTVESGKELVAYITVTNDASKKANREEATHSKTNDKGEPSFDDLKIQLLSEMSRRLPPYMIPAYVEILDAIPTLPSGKTDRKSLRPPLSRRLSSISSSAPFVLPDTHLEHLIADVWCSVFGLQNVSALSNFFTDLGGHSLAAANVVSQFRRSGCNLLQQVAISDLYAHPTIRTLSRSLLEPLDFETGLQPEELDATAPEKKIIADERIIHSSKRVWLCGFAQFAIAYAVSMVFSIPFARLLRQGIHPFSAGVIMAWAAFPILLILPFLAKWLLIGRYRPGRYPLWGLYYVRFWLASRVMALSPIPFLVGSPFLAPYMQLLGARIGRGCYLGSGRINLPDLVDIEDDVSIGYGAAIVCYVIRGGWLYLGPIKIKRGAFIGSGAVLLPGSIVGEDAVVLEQSLVAEGQVIPTGESWAGSPSRCVSPDLVLTEMVSRKASSRNCTTSLTLSYFLVLVLFFMCLLPALMAMPTLFCLWFIGGGDMYRMTAFTPVAGVMFVLNACFALALSKHTIMHRTRCGISLLRSTWGLRKWVSDKLMMISLSVTNSLYATLYCSPWLRALGAQIGPRSEVSTISNIDPDLVVFGEESFFADMAMVGAARHHRGCVFTGITEVGRRSFIGNAALINPQTKLDGNILIGVLSVPPLGEDDIPSGSNWLGSPAIFLPCRQKSKKYSEGVTYKPPTHLVATRLSIEFFRVVTPSVFLGTTAMSYLCLAEWLAKIEWLSLFSIASILPGLGLLAVLAMYLVIVLLKWVIIGRYHKHVAPLWSHFVWRSEFITALYENAAAPALLAGFQGTPFIGPLLGMLGARIGQRVYLETTYLTEFDLVHLEDDVAVGGTCSLQTHLFEDRVMKMDVVSVGRGASIGPRSIVLYGCRLEKGAEIDGLSLVMKGECISADSKWRGIPCSFVGRYSSDSSDHTAMN